MDNFIDGMGIVADFYNPFTGNSIHSVIEIKKEDFQVISGSLEDQRLVKAYRVLFRKNNV